MRVVCFSRGLFSYKSPLFFNPNFGLKNSPAKAPDDKPFARCDERPKALPLDTTNFLKKVRSKTSIFKAKSFYSSDCSNSRNLDAAGGRLTPFKLTIPILLAGIGSAKFTSNTFFCRSSSAQNSRTMQESPRLMRASSPISS